VISSSIGLAGLGMFIPKLNSRIMTKATPKRTEYSSNSFSRDCLANGAISRNPIAVKAAITSKNILMAHFRLFHA